MANAIRIENISQADQELAPGSGFIAPGGHADYAPDVYKDKHERYVKPRLEADPPLLKVTEFDSPEIGKREADQQRLAADDEKKAAEEKLAAEKVAQEQRAQQEGGYKRGR
jgi:hypothetical protein